MFAPPLFWVLAHWVSSQDYSNSVDSAALNLNFDRLIERTLKPTF